MVSVSNSTFSNATVDLDFHHFNNCLFENCILVYRGNGPVSMEGCRFLSPRWVFDGSALNTIRYLIALYHGLGEGGQKLVEDLFQQIRQGGVTNQVPHENIEQAHTVST